MSKHNATKKTLMLSLLSMVLCVSMLVGSTFAWFTDTATTGVNTIQAGTLDVALEMATAWDADGNPTAWTNAEGETLSFKKAANAPAGETVLWEPGCTYALPELRVINKGNLALKYKVVITGIGGDVGLNKVIDWTITNDGTPDAAGNYRLAAATLATDAGAAYDYDILTIKGHMQETAGNDYMGQSIEGISVTVYATQVDSEYDSNGNDYDKDATYPEYPAGVTKDSFSETDKAVDGNGNFYGSFEEAMENVEDGGSLYFKEGDTVDFATHLNVTKSVTIYGNGADFSGKDISIGTYAAPENGIATVNIYNAKNLVVWGQPVGDRPDVWSVNFYNCTNDGYNFLMYRGTETGTATINLTLTNCSANGFSDSIIHTTADGTIVIKNCTFTNNCAPVNIAHKQTGTMTVTVEDSTFIGCGKISPDNDYFAPARFVNNNANGALNVVLKNNTFTNTIGTNGDILLGDYRTGKESHKVVATIETKTPVMVKSSADAAYSYGGGTIAIPVVEVGTQEELEASVATAGSIKLSEGTYTLPNLESKDITFKGTKDTVIDMKGTKDNDGNYTGAINKASSASFEGVTVEFANASYKGFQHTGKLTYKDCTIKGLQFLYADDVEFINCEFVQENDDAYHIWTYGAKNVTFTDCKFYSKNNSKSILCYTESNGNTFTRIFNHCEFIATGTAEKSAIMINPTAYDGTNTYIININDCTATGYGENGISGQTIVGVKETVKDNITVSIDGTTVYTH